MIIGVAFPCVIESKYTEHNIINSKVSSVALVSAISTEVIHQFPTSFNHVCFHLDSFIFNCSSSIRSR